MRILIAFSSFAVLASSGLLPAQQPAPSARLFGFADFNYVSTNRPGAAEGFREGQLAGHLAAELTSRLSLFSEVTATPTATTFTVEVERAILRYDFTDQFKLSAGRYHTPLGYWNTAFHHGQWLQTTVGRPELIRFGGSFLPVHFVGVLAEGTLGAGGAVELRYALGTGNGRHANISRAGDAGDVNDRRAWTASVRSRLRGRHALEVGAAVYLDRVNPAGGPSIDERIVTAHVAWDGERPEVVAEYANARHAAVGGVRDVSQAGYLQVAYRFLGRARVLKPYARIERVEVPSGDPLLGPLGLDYRAVLAGMRYDFAPIAALKVEYRAEKPASSSWRDTFIAQLSFAFPGWREEGPPPAWSPGEAAGSRRTAWRR